MSKYARGRSVAMSCALTGTMAAILECVKLALSFIPNVEAVTLLSAVFGYVFGWCGFFAAVVFVCIEPMIYGFGTWVISYYLYWPFVAAVFMVFGRIGLKNRVVLTSAPVLLTVWFGVLSSLVDVGLFSGNYDRFFYKFGIYYLRGIVFYAIQILTNAVLFPLIFPFLKNKLAKIKGNLRI